MPVLQVRCHLNRLKKYIRVNMLQLIGELSPGNLYMTKLVWSLRSMQRVQFHGL